MSRLLVHVEGETEEAFVNEVLAHHLYDLGYESVGARLIGNSRQRERRGGIRGWDTVKQDILNHLREDPGCIATTMVDYYALPQDGPRAWPGRQEAGALPFPQKSATVQAAVHADVCAAMGDQFDSSRFVAYVMMHEFEGLLFSDCDRFASGIGHPELASKFSEIRSSFDSPEEINDSPQTAPSKRVVGLLPDYEKPVLGTMAVLEIGLAAIRSECPLFEEWLGRLEKCAA
jgi:hypothetical protein